MNNSTKSPRLQVGNQQPLNVAVKAVIGRHLSKVGAATNRAAAIVALRNELTAKHAAGGCDAEEINAAVRLFEVGFSAAVGVCQRGRKWVRK